MSDPTKRGDSEAMGTCPYPGIIQIKASKAKAEINFELANILAAPYCASVLLQLQDS